MRPFLTLSEMISAAVSASGFAPASTILGAVCFVLKAADGVSEVYAWIEELFDKLRDFTTRLNEYVQGGLPKAFRDKIVDIFGCLLEILACAEQAVKDGRWKKYAAVLFLGGDERVKAAFEKLRILFQGEQSLVIAITYATNQKMDKRIEEIGALSEAILGAVNKVEDEKRRKECMAWISNIDFTAQQSDNLGRRQANTGEWFLQNPIFTSWANGSTSSWGLFCQGAPGAGKTTMSATVIDHLSRLGSAREVGVAYIYCNYRSRTEQTLYNLLSSLLRRLVQLRSKVPLCVIEAYDEFGHGRALSLEECITLIGLVCKEFSVAYIIVDAVDESQKDVSRSLLKSIRFFQKQSNIRVMMTARFIPDIQRMVEEELGTLSQLEVRASDDDIRQYFESRQPEFEGFLKNNRDLCVQARDKVVEAAGGMFLLARLHVDQLADMVVPAQVKRALSKMFSVTGDTSQFMQAYNEQYDLAMERISNQGDYRAKVAKTALAWMTFACRPLMPIELCTALEMELSDDKSKSDPGFRPEIGLVVSTCTGLVTVDEEANVVRPAHYTTQEYLERTYEKWAPGGRMTIALTCISYLSMKEFKKGGVQTVTPNVVRDEDWNKRLSLFPLLDYSARYWGRHARPVEIEILNEISIILRHSGIRANISSVTNSYYVNEYIWHARKWRDQTPMMLIASEGLEYTLQQYLAGDLGKIWPETCESDCSKRDSPVTAAVTNGHTEVVKALLNQSVDISLWKDSDIALISAARGNYIDIVRMILQFWAKHGLDKFTAVEESKDTQDHGLKPTTENLPTLEAISDALKQAVDAAIFQGNKGIMQTLLKKGAVVSTTILDLAREGRVDGIHLLLELGHDVNFVDPDGTTALLAATFRGFRDIVLLLLKHGADTSHVGPMNHHVLAEAAKEGHAELVGILMEHGVDLDAYTGYWGRDTALILAARMNGGDIAVAQLLLEKGADVNMYYGGNSGNALQAATRQDYKQVCALLLDHGADVNFASGDPKVTPLETAYKNNSASVLKLLLERGAKIPSHGISFSGDFMEEWVRSGDRSKTVEVLRVLDERGVKLDLEGDGTHLPAIYEAVRNENFPVMQELLRLGADLYSKAGEHGNLLHEAVLRGDLVADYHADGMYPECVNLLLDHGFDPESSGNVYPNALSAAVMTIRLPRDGGLPHPAVFLLERGIKIPDNGPELLEQAVTKNLPDVVKCLVEKGVSINASASYPNLLVAACQPTVEFYNMAPILLELGADIDTMGPCALHEAALAGEMLPLEWLLENGVDVNAPGDEYANALITAVSVNAAKREYSFQSYDTLELLIKYGADMKVHGPAVLEFAIANNCDDDVITLLGGIVEKHEDTEDSEEDSAEEDEEGSEEEGEEEDK